MLMLIRLLFSLILVGNLHATSKLHNTQTRYDRRRQQDDSSTKDRLNLNELRLLEKYDNILTAINQNKEFEKTKKSNVEQTGVSAKIGGEVTETKKKREFAEFSKNNDGIVEKKAYKESEDRFPERDNSERKREEIIPQDLEGTGSSAGEREQWEFYKQMNDWIEKGERIFHSSNSQLCQHSTNTADEKKTNMEDENDTPCKANDLVDSENHEEKKGMKKEDEENFNDYRNDIGHWLKEIESKNNDNSKHWSNKDDEIFANVFENENKDEANHIRVLLDGEGDKTIQDEKHGDVVMNSMKKKLAFQVEGDKRNLEKDQISVDKKYTFGKHKKNIKVYPNKIKHHNAAWIKRIAKHDKNDNNKNKDSRFVNSAILFWIPKKKRDMDQRNQIKRGHVMQESDMSLTRKGGSRNDKRIIENTAKSYMMSTKQIGGSKDSRMSNEKMYVDMKKADYSWKNRYENMGKRSFNDRKTMKQEMKERRTRDSNENSKVETDMKDENQYDTDGSNVARGGLKVCLWGTCTKDQLYENGSDERSQNDEEANKRASEIQREGPEKK